jgi:hypothetical protein
MTHSPYLLFHQTAEQLRRVAARGGRAQRTQPSCPPAHRRSSTAARSSPAAAARRDHRRRHCRPGGPVSLAARDAMTFFPIWRANHYRRRRYAGHRAPGGN